MVGNVGTVRVFCQNNIQNLVSRGQAPLQGLVSSSSALVILHINNNILHKILFDLLYRKGKFAGGIKFYLSLGLYRKMDSSEKTGLQLNDFLCTGALL